MHNTTLVILAAGVGSRFKGGIKQLTKLNDKTIMELSIENAKKAGFNKVVFIIREELKDIFEEEIVKNINIDYDYAYQKIDAERSKPWGTGHALLSIKGIVNENFCIINADDYYEYDSFDKIFKFLNTNDKDSVMIGYKLKNTVFVDTGVNRGVVEVKDNKFVTIKEEYNIKKIDNKFMTDKELDEDSIVSMNIWGFRPNILNYFEQEWINFKNNIKDYQKDEFLLGDVINKLVENNIIDLYVIDTDSKCIGITYKEDIILFNEIINEK